MFYILAILFDSDIQTNLTSRSPYCMVWIRVWIRVCVCVISFFKSKRVAHRSTPPSNMDQTQVTPEAPVLASWLIHSHND